MQYKKTEATPDSELGLLKPEEERMIEAWAAGAEQIPAYQAGYGSCSGYSREALAVRACRKFAEPHIQAHMRALQAHGGAKARLSLEQKIVWEMAFAERCEAKGNMNAAGAARDRVYKLCGDYVDKVQNVTELHDPIATLEYAEKLFGTEAALKMAKDGGIEWQPSTAGATAH